MEGGHELHSAHAHVHALLVSLHAHTACVWDLDSRCLLHKLTLPADECGVPQPLGGATLAVWGDRHLVLLVPGHSIYVYADAGRERGVGGGRERVSAPLWVMDLAEAEAEGVKSVALSSSGKYLVGADPLAGLLHCWCLPTMPGTPSHHTVPHPVHAEFVHPILTTSAAPDLRLQGAQVAVAGDDGSVRAIALPSGFVVHTCIPHLDQGCRRRAQAVALTWSKAAATCEDGSVVLFDVKARHSREQQVQATTRQQKKRQQKIHPRAPETNAEDASSRSDDTEICWSVVEGGSSGVDVGSAHGQRCDASEGPGDKGAIYVCARACWCARVWRWRVCAPACAQTCVCEILFMLIVGMGVCCKAAHAKDIELSLGHKHRTW